MFERLLSFLNGSSDYETPLPPADVKHALGALMVRAAKADRAYLFEEVDQIDRVLAHMYDLNPVEAAKMRAACEKLEHAMPETSALTDVLHAAIDNEHREEAVSALWTVVFADGIQHEEEDVLLHQVEELLGVAPETAKALHDAALQRSKRP